VCVCVYICSYVYVCRYAYIYIYTHTHTHTHIYVYIFIHMLFFCFQVGAIGMLMADEAQFVQNFLTVIGLLFSILAGNAYSAL